MSAGRFIHPLDRKLLRDARRLWGQLLAAAMILASGVAVLVMTGYLFESLQQTQRAYYERYNFADVFAHARRAPLKLGDDIRNIPGVSAASLRIREIVRLDIPDLVEPASATIVSVPRYGPPGVNGVRLSKGRYVAPGRHSEVIASKEFADARGLAPGDALTVVINGRKRDLSIVGLGQSPEFIYAIAPGDLLPMRDRYAILWMARDSLERAYDLDGAFNDVALTLAPGADAQEAIRRLDHLLEPYGGTGAYAREDQVSHAFIQSEIDQNKASGLILPPVFLAVAAFMLHVAVTRLIEMEREQIGLLKAFGYSNLDVAIHYLKLALIPGISGGLLGAGLGSWAGEATSVIYTKFYNLPFMIRDVPASVYVGGLLVAVGVCASAAAIAVGRAVALDPAVAMRPQAPASFRRGLLDALWFAKHLPVPVRIVLRNVSRRPIRAALTTLGIAAGCSTIVAGTFMYDAMSHLMDVQFQQIQRHDVMLTFPLEQPADIVYDVAHLPGVIQVEGVRAAPIRLSHGSRVERVSLQGLPDRPDLNRPVDADVRPIAPPPAGVLMSRHLGEKLGLEPGDTALVEVLEGRRPTFETQVAGFVEDYVGQAAYMRRELLNRALGEAPSISVAYVTLDAQRYEAFFAAVKRSPIVQAASIRVLTIHEVEKTMEANSSIITFVFSLFAGSICFGVVYNSARIALSERGRELASLRVLGFTRSEVSFILLGEVGLLTLFALPLGGLLGYWNAALIATLFPADLIRAPLIVTVERYASAMLYTVFFAFVSGLIVRRRIDRLDLVAVLKTRE